MYRILQQIKSKPNLWKILAMTGMHHESPNKLLKYRILMMMTGVRVQKRTLRRHKCSRTLPNKLKRRRCQFVTVMKTKLHRNMWKINLFRMKVIVTLNKKSLRNMVIRNCTNRKLYGTRMMWKNLTNQKHSITRNKWCGIQMIYMRNTLWLKSRSNQKRLRNR